MDSKSPEIINTTLLIFNIESRCEAARLILDEILAPEKKSKKIVLDYRLLIRDSV